MPAIYAHDRFGRAVSGLLEGTLKEVITEYGSPFQIGLQGPDIFFFYGAHTNNKVVRFGQHLHAASALPFFRHAVKVVHRSGRKSPEYAYLLGFLCHFILDSECHPYVEQMVEEMGVQHMEIEEEFEKFLLRVDGCDPFSFETAELIPTDEATARAIQPFYPVKLQEAAAGNGRISVSVICRCLKDMKRIRQFFTVPQRWKQGLLNRVMKWIGLYPHMKGVMYQLTDHPACQATNLELNRRFEAAVPLAAGLIRQLDCAVCCGVELDARFDRSFG